MLRPAASFQLQQLCTRLLRTNRMALVHNRVSCFEDRLQRYTVGQSKRELAKIQVHRLPVYVTIQYKTYIHFL
jgi:hypothetical protein